MQEVVMPALVSPKTRSRHGAKSRMTTKGADNRPAPTVKRGPRATTKTADSKGRVVLGGEFANRPLIVEQVSETEVLITMARVIPEHEAWLYENHHALAAVRRGLAQARARKLVEAPDLDADGKLAAKLQD
jgi:hypothetical protein